MLCSGDHVKRYIEHQTSPVRLPGASRTTPTGPKCACGLCRDHSLDTVRRNELQYSIPLKIVSYKDLYGWTMDEIVKQIGTKSNCTFCGVFRRQVRLMR